MHLDIVAILGRSVALDFMSDLDLETIRLDLFRSKGGCREKGSEGDGEEGEEAHFEG